MDENDMNRCSCKADDYSTDFPCERGANPSMPDGYSERVVNPSMPHMATPDQGTYCEASYLKEIDELTSAIDMWRDKYSEARDKNRMAQAAVDSILREITHDRVKEVKMLIALEENLHDA